MNLLASGPMIYLQKQTVWTYFCKNKPATWQRKKQFLDENFACLNALDEKFWPKKPRCTGGPRYRGARYREGVL